MSDTHEARVIRIGEIRTHPNADRLALTTIGEGDGYQMVIGKDSFKTGDLAVFIQPARFHRPKHIREGIVVRSLETGRKLKVKSNEFLKIAGNR